MKLIANTINSNYLRDILPTPDVEVDGVLAAIAYGKNGNDEHNDFLGHCLANKYRLDIWMRYDHTVPVGVPMLKRLLRHHKDNIFCRLIPDYLHAKVIWWRGYGAYVGSANLTDRAWNTNIEAGIFFEESDLHDNDMAGQLEIFFEELRSLEAARPLTQEIIEEMIEISKARKDAYKLGLELRKQIPKWEGPSFVNKQKADDKRKENFRKEWQGTITILRDIGEQIVDYRPGWINADVPAAWQADQFLHAYYYTQISDGNSIPYEEEYVKNHGNPQAALKQAMLWWKDTTEPPTSEDIMLHDWAPALQRHLSSANIKNIELEGLEDVFKYTHATKDHISKMSLSTLGRTDITTLPLPERIPLYTDWLSRQRNAQGWDIKQLLNFILYGGADENLWERLYAAAKDKKYWFPHYGLNSMAELVGWVRPEVMPPRNGRTSKALRSLGFDVDIL